MVRVPGRSWPDSALMNRGTRLLILGSDRSLFPWSPGLLHPDGMGDIYEYCQGELFLQVCAKGAYLRNSKTTRNHSVIQSEYLPHIMVHVAGPHLLSRIQA